MMRKLTYVLLTLTLISSLQGCASSRLKTLTGLNLNEKSHLHSGYVVPGSIVTVAFYADAGQRNLITYATDDYEILGISEIQSDSRNHLNTIRISFKIEKPTVISFKYQRDNRTRFFYFEVNLDLTKNNNL